MGKNMQACPTSSILLTPSSPVSLCMDVEQHMSTKHSSSLLSLSTASGEREDALPQATECTDSTGLFKEAAGTDPSKHTLNTHILPQFAQIQG